MKLLLSIIVGCGTSVLYDAIIHGISSHGHGFLNNLFQNNPSRRISLPKVMSPVKWHVLADILIGVSLSILIVLVNQNTLDTWLTIGLLVGCLQSFEWIHVYAENELKWQISVVLGLLVILKSILISIAVGFTYY